MNPTTAEQVTATVTAFGHIQPSRYSNEQVQSVLFERWDRHDESRKVWKTYPVIEARQFHKNQNVRLIPAHRGNRQTWDVEWMEDSPSQSQPPYPKRSQFQEPEPQEEQAHSRPKRRAPDSSQPQPQPQLAHPQSHRTTNQTAAASGSGLTVNQKQEIATWIAHQADLYAFCFGEAQRALASREPEEETVRACASSLFISATRKFRLEL